MQTCGLFTRACRPFNNQHRPRMHADEVAEWLRRWTANPLCSARVGSNPILVGRLFSTCHISMACRISASLQSTLANPDAVWIDDPLTDMEAQRRDPPTSTTLVLCQAGRKPPIRSSTYCNFYGYKKSTVILLPPEYEK